jgi:hypothetical protein
MEIYLDKRAVKQIRLSAADAIEEGDIEALQVDIFETFPEEQVETLEQMLADGDLMVMIGELLEEWSGDDVDELFELLETQLGDHGIDLKYYSADDGDEFDEDEEDDDFDEEVDTPDDVETVAAVPDDEPSFDGV